jgi:putative sterol carrier protein
VADATGATGAGILSNPAFCDMRLTDRPVKQRQIARAKVAAALGSAGTTGPWGAGAVRASWASGRDDQTVQQSNPDQGDNVADKYEFLTDEWIAAAKKINDEATKSDSPPAHAVKMNLVITDAPFNDGAEIEAHMDTTSGDTQMDLGHIEGPDLTVTVDYDTARAIFIDQNPQAGMQAFMAGKVKVQGDMTKLMAMQQGTPDAGAAETAAKIKEITV